MFLQCVNPNCLSEDNPLDASVCADCGTLLERRHLWAIGDGAEAFAVGTQVGDRYHVMAPHIWLDMRPAKPPEAPPELPPSVLPYLKLFPYRLHVPTIYGFCIADSTAVLLLENAPIDRSGSPLPSLSASLRGAPAVRQVYWLWQLLELWVPLLEAGVASSVLVDENLRVEGWRVWVRSLYGDFQAEEGVPPVSELATLWQSWLPSLQPAIADPVRDLCRFMKEGDDTPAKLRAIATRLNQLLLDQAAQLPLRLKVAAATSPGPHQPLNEDACFPQPGHAPTATDAAVLPYLVMVCDGVGGHAGGEVASQMAVRSMQLQIRTMLADVMEETALLTPDIVTQQLESILRIVNNTIASQNDTQGREARDRMGTTLVMALQLPQKIATARGNANAHELYLLHLGDSRAYWLTPDYCQLLTVDDDLAGREVRLGRSLYRDALRRKDGGALVQALGTRNADAIYPTIQRFVVEEDGVLMLCSDGLSDNDRVSQHWPDVMRAFAKGKLTLEGCAKTWVELANQHNRHDNTSVVLLECRVSDRAQFIDPESSTTDISMPDLSESARVLLYGDPPEPVAAPTGSRRRRRQGVSLPLLIAAGVLAGMAMVGLAGWLVWQRLNPTPSTPQPVPESTESAE
ncbi:MAG: protein phosphatase 2C domain-containing protein [Kaiparowitsia implicata GSE-PSE-MK54-09C]|jgi:protein phosphatase|nr:protein phosphatase 2C domain-containing protein [Kaiparowitsia implicata GSE-PSE-MK54-09C]